MFITFCIVGNIITMMLAENDQTSTRTLVLDRINFTFSVIFIIEMVLKLLAFSKGYFLSGWNWLDFIIVGASILDIII